MTLKEYTFEFKDWLHDTTHIGYQRAYNTDELAKKIYPFTEFKVLSVCSVKDGVYEA